MGWKCPTCREHVYGNGKCPNCNPTICDICSTHDSVTNIQLHHVSYDLGITIGLCDTCHRKVHFPEERDESDNHQELDRLNPLADRGSA